MNQFQMRYLFISIILICSSCKVTTVKDFAKSNTPSGRISNPYFSDVTTDYVYKVAINLYGNALSGILVIKKIGKETHRMVCTSQFGSTFFDIEFNKEGHIVHAIVKQLDRKIVLSTLIKNFALMVKENDISLATFINSDYKVLMSSTNKGNNYYFYKKNETQLLKIVHTSRTREKFEIQFDEINQEGISEKISVAHKNIKLFIEFTILN